MARCSALRVRHIHVGVSCVIGTNMLAIVTLGSGVKNVKGGGKYSGRVSGLAMTRYPHQRDEIGTFLF